MTINQALNKARTLLQAISSADLDAQILLLTVLKAKNPSANSAWLLAHPNDLLDEDQEKQFFNLIKQRAKFEPIAYLTHQKEFFSRHFYVDQRVLIPRPETEILVEKAVELICHSRTGGNLSSLKLDSHLRGNDKGEKFSILELGTGSGCIIITIIKELEKKGLNLANFDFTATDISDDALEVAQKNARDHQVNNKITFLQSDLFDFINDPTYYLLPTTYSLILANLPYVPAYWLSESPSEFGLIHEPKVAIEGGEQGLELIDRFFSQVEKYLAKDGTIIIEFGDEQKDKLIKTIKKYLPKAKIEIQKDYQNLDRIAIIRFTKI